jgi:biopolymer transport protein ExbD
MRIRHPGSGLEEKIELQMTPMIDIVFQLLIFFILTFKIVTLEGDFNIKMPLAADETAVPDLTPTPPIRVRLTAGPAGGVGIQMGQRSLPSFTALRSEILAIVGGQVGPDREASDAEVELDVDYDLRYEYVIEAIDAISGYVDPEARRVVRLIDKIKFAPRRPPAD